MTLIKLIIHFVILLALNKCVLAIEMYPLKTTVCEMSKAKSDFEGKIVQVSGLYETDMRHGAYLSDSNCPKKAFRIGYFINENDPSIVKFEQDQGPRYTKLNEIRRIQVTVIGKLVNDEEIVYGVRKMQYNFRIIKISDYKFLPEQPTKKRPE